MTLPTSGPLTFANIQTEFGGSNPIGLNEYYAGGSYVASGTTGTYGAVPSSGQIGVQNFYGTSAYIPVYIEDVFSTYLYEGYGGTFSYNNGIDLSTKGGLVWIKSRTNVRSHKLTDTARGVQQALSTDVANAQVTDTAGLTAFLTNGFTLGAASSYNDTGSFASWTFRKQPKFFDVVTYTGTGSNTTIAHNLGSVPGCIIVKRTNASSNWQVYHNGLTSAAYSIQLNSTAAQASATTVWNSTAPTSTVFSVGTDATVNASGSNYVAYIYAHNAGGFGLTGTDNVISCGTFTGTGALQSINLGYEPQWLLVKAISATSNNNWVFVDTMREDSLTGQQFLYANGTNAETATSGWFYPEATGFNTGTSASSGITYIYIAIRRGPMKVPTDATKVFNVISQTPSNPTTLTNSFASDMILSSQRSNAGTLGFIVADKLRGSSIAIGSPYLRTPVTTTEANLGAGFGFTLTNTNVQENFWNGSIGVSTAVVYDIFQRAPSFFDEVCYTGTGVANRTVTHNLTVAPELMIIKDRTSANGWIVYNAPLGATKYLILNSTAASGTSINFWNNTSPTSTQFTVDGIGGSGNVNTSGDNYVAYLFATCAGVSKVGSFTGNGTTQAIACGFAGGARFVLIKRTDSAGDWYVYDTARGMTTTTDPYLILNSAAAEVATLGSVTTTTGGFTVNAAILSAINTNAATYIFLAIA